MAGFDRIDRISAEVARELDRILRDEVHDPRLGGTWSILRAEVTRDLRYCKVRVSVLEPEKRKDVMAALKSAAGFIRRELGRRVELRYVPELLFEMDTNIEYAAHISEVPVSYTHLDVYKRQGIDHAKRFYRRGLHTAHRPCRGGGLSARVGAQRTFAAAFRCV